MSKRLVVGAAPQPIGHPDTSIGPAGGAIRSPRIAGTEWQAPLPYISVRVPQCCIKCVSRVVYAVRAVNAAFRSVLISGCDSRPGLLSRWVPRSRGMGGMDWIGKLSVDEFCSLMTPANEFLSLVRFYIHCSDN